MGFALTGCPSPNRTRILDPRHRTLATAGSGSRSPFRSATAMQTALPSTPKFLAAWKVPSRFQGDRDVSRQRIRDRKIRHGIGVEVPHDHRSGGVVGLTSDTHAIGST